MGEPSYIPYLFVSLSQRFGLLLACAFAVLTLAPMGRLGLKRAPRGSQTLLQILLFGIFGILGTYTGNNVFQSYANLRAMAVITAGLFGGPAVGFGSALIAAGHRYLIDVGGFSALPCALATLAEGTAAGLIAAKLPGRSLDWRLALILGVVGESLHMGLVLGLSRPYEEALILVRVIGLPMIVVNSLGAALLVEAFSLRSHLRGKQDSTQVQQILTIASRTVGHLRKGLSAASAAATAGIIHELVDVAAVALTDKSEILAHVGEGADHHKAGAPIRTEATQRVLSTGIPLRIEGAEEIGCTGFACPLTSGAVVPLRKSGEVVGCLKLYGTRKQPLDMTHFELARGLAELFSIQLELEDIQTTNQLLALAEIRRLQAQINPHFLFNSLNTIASLCRTAPQSARELLLDLAHYMRQNLDSSRGFIPLSDELSRVRSYLSIEQARFGERIRCQMDVDGEVMDWPIPPLIIQPLVENGVKHGILPREEGGTVRVAARREDGHLCVCIEDDGVGMPEERQSDLVAAGGLESTSKGIGLTNCNQRLVQIFGAEYALDITSSPGSGTRISFRLPRPRALAEQASAPVQ